MTAFSPIEEIIVEIRHGRMVIIVDDEDRENEGDLVCASAKITPELINFMATHGRGLICAPITQEAAERLGLPLMVRRNTESHGTNFTVAVDAASGVTTGISSADRARTVEILANPMSEPQDLVRPGHILPLQAKQGGVLRRAGHTEAAVDLARLAGLEPAGVICEILNEDGTMARLPQLLEFAEKHQLKIGTIEALIDYRRSQEKLIERIEKIQMPTDFGTFDLIIYASTLNPDEHHLALVKGEILPDEPVLVRVHSECLTGDVFGSRRCDCGSQLHSALAQIEEAGKGVLVYMRQEGRGIGLANKIRAYKLQEEGLDTVEANERLGFGSDLRDYGMGAQILYDLGVRKIRLMTNNPRKVVGLDGHRLEIVEKVPIMTVPNEHNERYLGTKRDKLGHFL
ncbi:MAG: bifunctional 3,4-dihydroxy-2-butanone-4-phosphate synthase/GTP cyclohydrolase II [Verrucomicrobiales bacterium]|jgi:3,4-dihydroxy 2-butanone 4-phosphate synthase / GTP cyclohydrolase II|nr:bifunctional 3,4-dihydroxy-2-butanone-4-phosphate synthase/GTP cyclohydrolase II [Verrucomicrobiales bacterium]MDP5004698.1 bifunctional 3,4-dihydroxy-2-butanone-4-phosphate synthase/GTP cyclohydrolase II [Verrucomicrobiales bacterium]